MMTAIPLYAHPTLQQYQKQINDPIRYAQDITKTLIYGIGIGFFLANIELNNSQLPRLFCTPTKLALDTNNYIRILDDQIERTPYGPNTPIGCILLDGLKATFPCGKPNK
jgi:hypothetical protein